MKRILSNLFNYVMMDMYIAMIIVTAAHILFGTQFSVDTGAIFHLVNEYTSQFGLTNKDVGDFV